MQLKPDMHAQIKAYMDDTYLPRFNNQSSFAVFNIDKK